MTIDTRKTVMVLLIILPFSLQSTLHSSSKLNGNEPSIDSSFSSMESRPIKELKIEDVLQQTITYNPKILTARADWLARCRQRPATWAIFEPEGTAKFNGGQKEQRGSRFPENRIDYNFGIEGKFISGAEYSIGLSVNDIQHSASTTEKSRAFSGITISQPLLRGAWFGAPTTEIKIAKIDMNIAFHHYRSQLMNTLYTVESAYWNCSFAQEKLRFTTESVEIARKLLDDSRLQLKTGKMSKMGLLEAEAELAHRIALQTDAERELYEASNQLKITMSNSKIDSRYFIRTASKLFLSDSTLNENLLIDSISNSLISFQPDYLVNHYESIREKVVVSYQSNQCLPSLNFNSSIGHYATASTGQKALADINHYKMIDWSIGIEARVPLLFGTKARSDLIAARLKSQAVLENTHAKEYELLNTLILIKDRLESLKERIKKARIVVAVREKILDTEIGSIKAGKSNFRRAYTLEENLSKAKQWELESHVLFKLTRVQWELVSGTLLQKKGFESVKNDEPVLIEHLSGPYKYLLWFLLKDREIK